MKVVNKRNIWLIPVSLFGIVIIFSLAFYIIGNTTVSYYDSVEQSYNSSDNVIGPCEANKLTSVDTVDFVFTEPFTSLGEYEKAPIKKTVTIHNGKARLSLLPGRYGLYMKFKNGEKQLYGNLTLENSQNDTPRNEQGPWFVTVYPFSNTFIFRSSLPC